MPDSACSTMAPQSLTVVLTGMGCFFFLKKDLPARPRIQSSAGYKWFGVSAVSVKLARGVLGLGDAGLEFWGCGRLLSHRSWLRTRPCHL